MAIRAYCELQGENWSGISGAIYLQELEDTTQLWAQIGNLDEGEHGFHIHEEADIVDGCAGAGGHFNPAGNNHAGLTDDPSHVGDLGNIVADADRSAEFSITTKKYTLREGKNNVMGRAIVVHEGKDDLGQGGDDGSLATGNAGARVGCCVITLLEGDLPGGFRCHQDANGERPRCASTMCCGAANAAPSEIEICGNRELRTYTAVGGTKKVDFKCIDKAQKLLASALVLAATSAYIMY